MTTVWELRGLEAVGFDPHYREINILDEHFHRQNSTVNVFVIEAL